MERRSRLLHAARARGGRDHAVGSFRRGREEGGTPARMAARGSGRAGDGMSARVRVAHVADVPEGEGRVVDAEGKTLALFNVDGTFYALDNACPHRGGPLGRSEEHTSELQSRENLVCRLLLEKK